MNGARVGLIVLVCSGVFACATPPEEPKGLPNMVVVLVDTLRADRLGAYGNTRGLTPFIDTLAARGFVFENAIAQSSWTNPSIASLFTSRYQWHGVVAFESVIPPAATLASALRDFGYATGGFVANGMLAADEEFGRGFEEYQALWPEVLPPPSEGRKRRAEEVDKLAFAWLDRMAQAPSRPLFLYLHYLEPHLPYAPPAPLLARMFGTRPIPDLDRLSHRMLWGTFHKPDDDTCRDAELAYDAEVASIDASLKGAFADLERRGILQRSIVVFTADHGEEFGEHGGFGHRTTLYNELIHVPLIVILPGQTVGRRIPDVVSLVDVAPTLLDLVGTSRPSTFEGRSLRKFFAHGDGLWSRLAFWRHPEPGVAFSELESPSPGFQLPLHPHATAIVLGTRKLLVNWRNESELYDLARDPGERTPVAGEEDDELRRRLVDFIRQPDGTSPSGRRIRLDEETERRLHALGYVN